MNSDTRLTIARLEAEREEIQTFYDEVQRQVTDGKISPEIAKRVIALEFNGRAYNELIAEKNRQILDARASAERTRVGRTTKIAGSIIALVLIAGLFWNILALSGLFTLQGETFYRLDTSNKYTSDTVIPLDIQSQISSFRIEGSASGSGTANVWLVAGDTRHLVARFDASGGKTGITGLVVVDDTSSVGALANELQNSTNVTDNQTQLNESVVQTELQDNNTGSGTNASETLEVLNESAGETNVTLNESGTNAREQTPATIESNETNTTQNNNAPVEEIVLTPTAPTIIESPPIVESTLPRVTQVFDKECLETCDLPGVVAQRLEIEISGDVELTISSMIYGQREFLKAQLTEAACVSDADCNGGVCISSRFQGTYTPAACAQDRTYCFASTSEQVGTLASDSICVDAREGSVWLAQEGQGRFTIRNSEGTAIAALDKYGMMVISGNAYFSATVPQDENAWSVIGADGNAVLSIDANGDLYAKGALLQNSRPVASTDGDFVIQDTTGTVQIVLTETGDVLLSGTLATGGAP